jgi:hypothetical protein
MASQYPPENFPIVDPGNVPEFWIDGLGAFALRDGVMRCAYFSYKPLLYGSPCTCLTGSAELAVKLVFPAPALLVMRRQMDQRLDAGERTIVTAMTC